MDILTQKVKNNIEKQKILSLNDRILVCVSGGPDSVFLLHVLSRLKDDYKLALYVAHLNHALRGRESDKDEVFVRSLAEKFNIPFYSQRVDTLTFSRRKKLSLEDAARQLRYDFFLKIARRLKINKIAVAHTKDDQAETMLMRLLRGTGVTGLCAMRFISKREGRLIIRPLLEIEKEEILSYLARHKIACRTDRTNLKTDYFRNKIRLQVFPYLEKFSPGIKNNLFKLGQNLKEIEEFLQDRTERCYIRLVQKEDEKRLRIKKKDFLGLMPVLRKALLRKILESLKGNLKRIDFKHIRSIEDFIVKDTTSGKGIDLPAGMGVKKISGDVIFFKKTPLKGNILKKEYLLKINQKLSIPGFGFAFLSRVLRGKVNIREHSKLTEYFDAEKIKFPLLIRTRREGDVFYPLGTAGRKKLKKFFIDEKAAVDVRDKIPLILCGSEIIWVVGIRISERFKVTDNTKHILKIQALGEGRDVD